jgi:hypothetical protein
LITPFAGTYPREIAGLVYIEAMDLATREEKAARFPPEQAKKVLEPPTLPPIPPDTPAGLRAEYEVLGQNMLTDFAEARSFTRPMGVPVAVIVAAPPGRTTG